MKIIYSTALLLFTFLKVFPQAHMYEIANCNGEGRIGGYIEQLSSVMWCLKGDVKFKESIKLKYSKDSHVNLDSLELKAIQVRKILPRDYWSEGVGVTRLDTKPNEDGNIWFQRIYVDEDSKHNIRVYAACKVIFEGTDPTLERAYPKVRDIIVVLDPKELKKYTVIIKKLIAANNITPPTPQKRGNKTSKDEKPPEVQKLEN